jgi:hypothetical protein
VVDRLEVWTPRHLRPVSLDDVRAWLIEMCRSYKATLIYDPSQAYLMVEQIRKAHIQTKEFLFTSSSVGHLATDLMQALRGRLITLPNDEALREEILSVRLRESSPNVLRIDTATSREHDDRVIAVAMAVNNLSHDGEGSTGWLEAWGAEMEFGSAGAIPEGYFDVPTTTPAAAEGEGGLEEMPPCTRADCSWRDDPTDVAYEECVTCNLFRDREAK